jgi:hypothetical protein
MTSPAGSSTVTIGTSSGLPSGPLYVEDEAVLGVESVDSWESAEESYDAVEPLLVLRMGPKGNDFWVGESFWVDLRGQYMGRAVIIMLTMSNSQPVSNCSLVERNTHLEATTTDPSDEARAFRRLAGA